MTESCKGLRAYDRPETLGRPCQNRDSRNPLVNAEPSCQHCRRARRRPLTGEIPSETKHPPAVYLLTVNR